MNADGMPSLWVQTVCVYSVRGLFASAAPDCSASRTQHAAAQKKRIRLAARKDRMSHACSILPLNYDGSSSQNSAGQRLTPQKSFSTSPDRGSQRSGYIQFGRRLLKRLHSVPVDRKRGRDTFLDGEQGHHGGFSCRREIARALGFLLPRLVRFLTFGATLERLKEGSKLISATGATNSITFASP